MPRSAGISPRRSSRAWLAGPVGPTGPPRGRGTDHPIASSKSVRVPIDSARRSGGSRRSSSEGRRGPRLARIGRKSVPGRGLPYTVEVCHHRSAPGACPDGSSGRESGVTISRRFQLKRSLALALVAACVAALGGCANDVSRQMTTSTETRTKVMDTIASNPEMGGRRRWTA